MCYENWITEKTRAEEEAARQRAQELIDKARAAKPMPPQEAPVVAEKDKEPAPA
jgi:hypothetical protein